MVGLWTQQNNFLKYFILIIYLILSYFICSEDTLQDEYKIVERLLVENSYPAQFAKLREPNWNERNVHQPERKKIYQ